MTRKIKYNPDREVAQRNADRLLRLAQQVGNIYEEANQLFKTSRDLVIPDEADSVLEELELAASQLRQIATATDRGAFSRLPAAW